MTSPVLAEVIITNDVGLHARPSVKFTKLAKRYACAIEISIGPDGQWIDAKSIVKVMGAKAPKGTTLRLKATGEQAEEAVAALVALVDRQFDEGHEHAGTDQA